MQRKTPLLGFLVTLICAAPPLATAGAQQANPEAAQVQEAPCTPVARLFGQAVCKEDVSAADEHIAAIKKQYETQGLDPEKAIGNRNNDQLRDMLWMIALHEKFGAARIEPTAEEIYLYSKALKDSLRRSHEENLQAAAKIKDMLAHRTYSQGQELRLRSLLASIETSVAFYQKREAHKGQMPPEFDAMVAEAERGIAKAAVRDWKVNKALYEEYGGKLVLLPSGLQPAEAYGRFVDFIRSEGGLEIVDPAYKDVFAEMEKFAAGPHETLSAEDEAVYKDYFSSPLWQFEHRAEMTRKTAQN